QKNDGQETASLGKNVLQFQTADGRHGEIEHETTRRFWIVLCQEFLCRGASSHREASRSQQARDGSPTRRIIVHDKDGRAGRTTHHRRSGYKDLFGRRIFKQSEMERRAALGIVCGPQFSSMRTNDGSADRKTKSHSLGFRGEERLEDLFHFFHL